MAATGSRQFLHRKFFDPPIIKYTFAAATVVATVVIRRLLYPITGLADPYALFLGAVLATSLLAGYRAGVFAAVLSIVVGAFELVVPGYDPKQTLALVLMMVVDCAVVLFLSFLVVRDSARLRESEERFRLTTEEAPIGMALVGLDGMFLRANRAFCELVGYSESELQQFRFQDITHPDDREANTATARELASGAIPRVELEKRYIRKDGGVVTAILSASVLRGPGGEPRYFISQMLDVTNRTRIEDALRFSRARFEGIIAIAADAIISVDQNLRITLFNEGAERIFGYTRAEVMGKPQSMLQPERNRARYREEITAFGAKGDRARPMNPSVGLRKNGEEFPIEGTISRLQLGTETILTVALRDVTEQRRIEREQRLLAEAGKLLSASLDYEETLTNVGELVAREMANWCVIEIAESEQRPRRLRVVPDDPRLQQLVEAVERLQLDPTQPHLAKQAWDTHEPFVIENIHLGDLETFAQSREHLRLMQIINPRSFMGIPLTVRGHTLGVLLFVSSAPEHTFTAADLPFATALGERAALAIENGRNYQAALQATRLRDQVLGVVAHDLRNPIAVINFAATGHQPKAGEPDRRNPKWTQAILRSTGRMNRLIADLLDITRIEAGSLSVERTPLSPADLLVECMEAEGSLAAGASLSLRLEIADALPDILGDHDRLLQVLENLIGNAIKFTPAGGRITVSAKPRRNDVLFSVTDTGRGITDEAKQHVFDRFWQVSKGSREGAGLGLPIVRGIVEAHGGDIWVESELGHGSTFYFTIPCSRSVEKPGREPRPSYQPSA